MSALYGPDNGVASPRGQGSSIERHSLEGPRFSKEISGEVRRLCRYQRVSGTLITEAGLPLWFGCVHDSQFLGLASHELEKFAREKGLRSIQVNTRRRGFVRILEPDRFRVTGYLMGRKINELFTKADPVNGFHRSLFERANSALRPWKAA